MLADGIHEPVKRISQCPCLRRPTGEPVGVTNAVMQNLTRRLAAAELTVDFTDRALINPKASLDVATIVQRRATFDSRGYGTCDCCDILGRTLVDNRLRNLRHMPLYCGPFQCDGEDAVEGIAHRPSFFGPAGKL